MYQQLRVCENHYRELKDRIWQLADQVTGPIDALGAMIDWIQDELLCGQRGLIQVPASYSRPADAELSDRAARDTFELFVNDADFNPIDRRSDWRQSIWLDLRGHDP